MDICNYKIVKRDAIDQAQDKILNDLAEQTGSNKYYVLGEINLLRMFLSTMRKDDKIDKTYLISVLKAFSEEYDWSSDLIKAIIDEYE